MSGFFFKICDLLIDLGEKNCILSWNGQSAKGGEGLKCIFLKKETGRFEMKNCIQIFV